jgi:phosphinothricin acetyltransferase
MIDVRPAREDDLAAILEIYNHAIAHTTAVFSYAPHTIGMRREWFAGKLSAGYPVLAAERDRRVIGFATYGPFRAWPAYKYTVEHSVYTAPDARRIGAGRLLMQALIAEAEGRGYHAVIGGIVAENVASLRLHESLGFVEVAHFREVGFKFGRWLDLKFLQRLLPGPARPVDG